MNMSPDAPARDAAEAADADIEARHWSGAALDCSTCAQRDLLQRPSGQGCQPGHACLHDAYARRISRFLSWHPGLADAQLLHPYFEVRAIAVRHASLFRLPALLSDPDETVRMQVVQRLPMASLLAHLTRLARDPHREVRLRVAQRVDPVRLGPLMDDPDYGVRECVAARLPLPLLGPLMRDPDRAVRLRVAQRLEMPALLALADDPEGEVRRAVAQRLPAPLLPRLMGDTDWRVRWEVAQRAAPASLAPLLHDDDPEVRAAARSRLPLAPAPQAAPSTHRSPAHG